MKNQTVTIVTRQYEPVFETFLAERDSALQELARKKAIHYAKKNLPAATGDFLPPYTDELKTGYEKLAADACKHLQPSSHLPQGKMDIEHAQENDRALGEEIDKKEAQIHNDEFDLGPYEPKIISNRIRFAIGLTGIITVGEIAFNAKAFQIIGGNLLFALIISIGISAGVLFFSHFIPIRIKAAKTDFQKRLIAIGSLLVVTAVFIAMGVFRSRYLASHGIKVNPFYFVVINLFLFIVSCLISYYTLPSLEEIKTDKLKSKLCKKIVNGKKEVEQLKSKRKTLQVELQENLKNKLRLMHYANYATQVIRKMYWHAVAIFKSTNLTYRTDGKVPDCYLETLPEPDINDNTIHQLNSNRKAS